MNLIAAIKHWFKRYFVVGLITIIPFAVTIQILLFVLNYFDSIIEIQGGRFLYFVPGDFHPDRIIGFHIPFLGLAFTIFVVLVVGALSRNFFGRKLLRWFDRQMSHIPMLRVIYNMVKQAIETFTKDRQQFSSVVMIEYPRKGLYTIAFVTGKAPAAIQAKLTKTAINVFVPTTPNPTSGFYLIVPEEDATAVDISVEDAFKLILTGGMISGPNG